MHCCEIARAGFTLPSRLPQDWRVNVPFTKSVNIFNSELHELFKNGTTPNNERKNSVTNFEDERQKNIEVR